MFISTRTEIAKDFYLKALKYRPGGQYKYIIYGEGDNAVEMWDILHILGVAAEYFIFDNVQEGQQLNGIPVKMVEEILYEDCDFMVIVADYDKNYRVQILPMLLQLGLTIEDIYYYEYYSAAGNLDRYIRDGLLLWNFKDEVVGFSIFGEMTSKFKIVTLGGSTTDASSYEGNICWSQYLYEKLISLDVDACVLCGGLGGYNSTQELLKLYRDVLPLNPSLVISYSGVNDINNHDIVVNNELAQNRPYLPNTEQIKSCTNDGYALNKAYWGMQNEISPARHWCNNMMIMHKMLDMFNSKFIAFLQPCYLTSANKKIDVDWLNGRKMLSGANINTNLIDSYKKYYCETVPAIYDEIRSIIKEDNISYIVDISKLFEGKSEHFYDSVHVLNMGNELIAERVLAELINLKML